MYTLILYVDKAIRFLQRLAGHVRVEARCEEPRCKKKAVIAGRAAGRMYYYVCSDEHESLLITQRGLVAAKRLPDREAAGYLGLRAMWVPNPNHPHFWARWKSRAVLAARQKRLAALDEKRKQRFIPKHCPNCGLPLSGFYPGVCTCDRSAA